MRVGFSPVDQRRERSKPTPARQGLREGYFVRRFEGAADRQTKANAGYGDPERTQEIGQIMRGGFAFDFGTKRKDDLGGFFLFDALHQFGNA